MKPNNTTAGKFVSISGRKIACQSEISDFIQAFEPYLYFGEYETEIKATTITLVVVILITSTVLHGGIILFERFGEDSQKRSLLNMLASSYSFWNLCYIWLTTPILTHVYVSGPLNHFFASVFIYGRAFTVHVIFIILLESLFARFIFTFIFKKPILQDFYIATFLSIKNVIISALLTKVQCNSLNAQSQFSRYTGVEDPEIYALPIVR